MEHVFVLCKHRLVFVDNEGTRGAILEEDPPTQCRIAHAVALEGRGKQWKHYVVRSRA